MIAPKNIMVVPHGARADRRWGMHDVPVLREELGFDNDEYQAFNLRTEGGSFHWDETKERSKEVSVPITMQELIISAFGKLSKENALHLEHVDLYERFMLAKAERLAEEAAKAADALK